MNRKAVHFLLAFVVLLLGGELHSPIQQASLQRELQELRQQGAFVRFLDNSTVEVSDPVSGLKRVKTLQEPSEAEIRAWALARGIPILEIDPRAIDTSRFTGWYRYWTTVPISKGLGEPMVVGDVDRNARVEAYGSHFDSTNREPTTRIYEIDSAGNVQLRFIYSPPSPGISRLMVNVNNDSLTEVMFTANGLFSDYEQATTSELPTALRFVHQQFTGNVGAGFTGIFVGSLDGDGRTDFLYVGSERDSSDTTRGVVKQYVAEYDAQLNNFRRVWGIRLHPNLGGFAVADFDLDGRKEFVSSSVFGNVYVVENLGDDQYQLVWQDSLPFVNVYYQTAGDVDNDGRPEFFVGAVTDGYWLTMYEADRDNHYVPKLLIHFLSGDLFPTNLTTDVDGDGKLELVVMVGRDLYVFKSNTDDTYYVWYLKREDRKDAIQLYNLNRDGRKDFIITKSTTDSQGRLRLYADAYLSSNIVGVNAPMSDGLPAHFKLETYPNPFNPAITIRFQLPNAELVSISAVDIAGRIVARLMVTKLQEPGNHTLTWSPDGLASGIYFIRLATSRKILVKKTILIR